MFSVGCEDDFKVVTTFQYRMKERFHCDLHLLLSPLGPNVVVEVDRNSEESNDKESPKDPIENPQVSVEGITHPVDGRAAGVLFSCLEKGILCPFFGCTR